MSEKCLYCQVPIEQKEGKRERKFCCPSHCTMYHLAEKNKDKPKGKRGRPAGAKNKINVEKFKKELALEKEMRQNPLINAARGRDSSGVNEDEMRVIKCQDRHTGKTVWAYHVGKDNLAYNKDKTLCIGMVGIDLIVEDKINTINIDGFQMDTKTIPVYEVEQQSEWGSEMNAHAIKYEIAGMGGRNKIVDAAIKKLKKENPTKIIGHDSVTFTSEMSVVEIRKKLLDDYADKADKLLAVYNSGKEPTEDVIALANEMAKIYNIPVMKEAIDELTNFGTVTIKTELVDNEVKQSVVDKKQIVSEKKPTLSPFMLARQKAKGGGQ